MKKLFGILTVVALVTTAAFAQEEAEGISFSASGRAVWMAVANSASDSGDPITVGGLQLPWSIDDTAAHGPRNDFTIKGTSEHIGFWLDLRVDGATPTLGGNALIWAKPFSWARLVFAGKHDENVGRSGATWGLWDWDRIGVYSAPVGTDNFIFPDLLDKSLSVEITPIEGLLIAGAIDLPLGVEGAKTRGNTYSRYDDKGNLGSYVENGHNTDDKWLAQNIFGRNGSIVIAYTAAEIVTIKFGLSGYVSDDGGTNMDKMGGGDYASKKDGSMWYWVGGTDGWNNQSMDFANPVIIDAAVEATPIEGLTLALGAHAPTVSNNFVGGNYDPRITFLAKVGMVENLNIGLRFGLKFLALDGNPDKMKNLADEEFKDSVGFTVGAGVDYTFDGPGVNIFLDVGYADGIWMNNNSYEGNDSFTIGLGVSKKFTNGSLGIAFAGTTNGDKYGRHILNPQSFAWEIPVMVTYSF